MTDPQMDDQPEIRALDPVPPETAAVEAVDADSRTFAAAAPDAGLRPTGTARVASAVRRPAHEAMAAARTGTAAARRGVTSLVARLPGTIKVTRSGAHRAVGALQTLPDETLKTIAAASIGLGTGLSFTRAGRAAVVAGGAAALVVGTAIAVRPVAPDVPDEASA